ncbi:MAG: hypothetical protein WCJ09_18410, partial [Planctomycetota bacterium]
ESDTFFSAPMTYTAKESWAGDPTSRPASGIAKSAGHAESDSLGLANSTPHPRGNRRSSPKSSCAA